MSNDFGLNGVDGGTGTRTVNAASTDGERLAREMTSLYEESVRSIFNDDTMVFHIVPMADFDGDSFISSSGTDPDLDMAAEAICGTQVNDMDCVVVLGSDVLGQPRTEDEMAQVAIEHLSEHIDSVWNVTDSDMGWVKKPIGSTVIAGLLTCAHPVLSAIDDDGEIISRVKDRAITELVRNKHQANQQATQAITKICEEAAETNGGYLALPANVNDLISASREVFCNTVDRMESRPMGVV